MSIELTHAVRAAVGDQTYLSPGVANIVVKNYVHRVARANSVFSVLTARERDVTELLAKGRSTKEIASCLQVSVKTVETHRRHVMKKLDIHSIAELTKCAIREGLISLEP